MTIPVTVAELDAMRSELETLRGNEVRVQELESTEGQIAALEGKGYAVVKLPAPNSSGRWSISASNDLWVEDDEVCQVLPKSSGGTIAYRSPSLVRKIAATLLSAAIAAEQVQP